MSSQPDHDPCLDNLGASLRTAPAEPPAAFMGAVRRRHRRDVLVRVSGIVLTSSVIVVVALAIAWPALRRPTATQAPIASGPSGPSPSAAVILPTAANLRSFIDDPTILDRPPPSSPDAGPIRAGDRPDAESVRRLLTLP